MSALFRLSQLRGCQRGLSYVTTSARATACRGISTAPKKDSDMKSKFLELYPTKKEPWVSYGFDNDDKDFDRFSMHVIMFMAVSVGLVWGSFVICYYPDLKMKNWAHREAFLQLRYREEHGLPLVDPNYIDPDKIILPTEEELGDAVVIV